MVNSRKYIKPSLVLGLSLVGVNILFALIQLNHAESNLKRVEAIFQNNAVGSNPNIIMTDLLEMRNRDLINCISLTQLEPIEQKLATVASVDCLVSNITLNARSVNSTVHAANGSVWKVEFNSLNPSGFNLLLWIVRLLAVSLVCLFYFSLRQREKRVQEKEAIKASYQAERARMARQLAHDIRSPLSALRLVINSTENLRLRESIVLKAIERIEGLAQDLLDETRETKHLSLTSLNNCLDQIIEEVKARENSINLRVQFDVQQKERTLRIEGKTLQRIIANLLQNSIDASVSPQVFVKVSNDSQYLKIVIEDNGIGFPSDYNLQSHQSIGKFKGNGLGLDHAIKVMREIDGKISIENLEAGGARVSLSFPFVN